jgi:hypothetical protein
VSNSGSFGPDQKAESTVPTARSSVPKDGTRQASAARKRGLQSLETVAGGGDVEAAAAHRHRRAVGVRSGELSDAAHQLEAVLPLDDAELAGLRIVEPAVEGRLVAQLDRKGDRAPGVEDPGLDLRVVERGQQRCDFRHVRRVVRNQQRRALADRLEDGPHPCVRAQGTPPTLRP